MQIKLKIERMAKNAQRNVWHQPRPEIAFFKFWFPALVFVWVSSMLLPIPTICVRDRASTKIATSSATSAISDKFFSIVKMLSARCRDTQIQTVAGTRAQVDWKELVAAAAI